ncbi:hypothetical protein WAI453_005125 [Rhynchosporium graminicola]|uniref:Related to DNA repair helicase ERCC6 n=1 Tax=Rhynchosporium graminicola TaxID=2792576 RepID=A0A1E1LAV8_9HELO|nr:related to DNA repair helicase ERCC6 [Rhynchosporium commune]
MDLPIDTPEFPDSTSSPPNTIESNGKPHLLTTTSIGEAIAACADEAAEDEVEPASRRVAMDEASALEGLTENVREQGDLERDITNQAKQVMIELEDERDEKRISKANGNMEKLEGEKQKKLQRLKNLANTPTLRKQCLEEVAQINDDISALKKDVSDIQGRINARHTTDGAEDGDVAGNKRMPNESQRDFLIRTGKITPFSRVAGRESDAVQTNLSSVLMDAEEEAEAENQEEAPDAEPRSHQNLRLPGFAGSDAPAVVEEEFGLRPRKKKKLNNGSGSSTPRARQPPADEEGDFAPEVSSGDHDEFEEEDDSDAIAFKETKKRRAGKAKADDKVDFAAIDDGNEEMYQARLNSWVEKRRAARLGRLDQGELDGDQTAGNNEEEWFKPCPDAPDHQFENGIKLPGDVYPALFDYQKTGVQWLGELYAQQVGGIIGDEMGLGKTIQIISFLAGLHYSKKLTKPIIVVAPATVLRQWVNEFHRWWPPLRVSILHSSGSGMMNVRSESRFDEVEELYGRGGQRPKSSKAAKKIVDRVKQHGHVLVTTYAGLQTYSDVLIPVDWDYVVLDEGHKIRNPNTTITIHCKELRTPNRVILSGTPMQNNLTELWSLFDFVFPMRLGTLVNFRMAFEVPIKLGGYANATNLQVLTATKCAETLKSAISPYLLQRLKVDVASDLPKKSEQVLFCKLTKPQRDAYEMFLSSDEMTSIMNRTTKSFSGITILRKICNHPDLLDERLQGKPGYKYGNPNKSGKLQVVKALLEMWKGFKHKTLLFSQGVQMLDIIEDFIKGLGGFNYLRMDGKTPIKDRQALVDRFNNDPDLHVFLLTTKVGGLGVNLTGANRVIIFDPDWNPSTDIQARERAWRLGQKKEVTIYRLMTAGTIEEKIYHRQIFKQFLTNKILKDPTQQANFHMKDLYDLFTLGGTEDGTTETGEMFKGTEVQFRKTPEPAALEDNLAIQSAASATAVQNDVVSQGVTQASGSGQGDAEIEVRNLTGVASLEAFHGDPEEEKPTSDEARLMEGIFARSGVHSALEHDQIINGKRKITADRGMIEREAKKVAAEAAASLRRAGVAAQNIAPGTVTWTGEFGSAGRPVNNRRGAGGSSAAVLSGLAGRQGITIPGSASSSRSGTPGAGDRPARPAKDFMKLIRDFIRAQGGSVPSQALVNHFNRMCTTDQQSAQFKHMLGEIAYLEKGNNLRMRGRWILKDEFK